MQTMKLQEAILKGFEYCIRDGSNVVTDIKEIEELDLIEDNYYLAETEHSTVSISSEELIEYCIDFYFNVEENPDDTDIIQNTLKENKPIFEEFATKINVFYAKRPWWEATTILLVPNDYEEDNFQLAEQPLV